jgi:hypothetical protein
MLSPPDYDIDAHLVCRSRFVRSSVGIKWNEINFASRFVRFVGHRLLLGLNGSCFVDKETLIVFIHRFICMLSLKCRICSFTELVLLPELAQWPSQMRGQQLKMPFVATTYIMYGNYT